MEEIKKRGLNKENINRLIKWEGFKAELPWILFILFLCFSAYSYRTETKSCSDMVQTKCYQQCKLQQYIIDFEKENPGAKANCFLNNNTNEVQCQFAGIQNDMLPGYYKLKETISDINKIKLLPNQS